MPRPFACAIAALATRHDKARAIAPALETALGLHVRTVDLDTDRFGTFTRDRERFGTQLDAARAKALAALDADSTARFGVASEGSFGPHASMPWLISGHEIVVLVDRESGRTIVGADVAFDTNYAQREVVDVDGALAFARSVGFPTHAIVVAPPEAIAREGWMLTKGLVNEATLGNATRAAIDRWGRASIETDMRAHVNPTRMTSIARAAEALARRAASECPRCAAPGFAIVERVRGLPCEGCGAPTDDPRADLFRCDDCAYVELRERAVAHAPMAHCPECNP